MQKIIPSLLLLCALASASICNAQIQQPPSLQTKDVEAKYLGLFSSSFISKDVSHRATNLFWSLCVGDTAELSNEELSRRYAALITDTSARIAFYKRFNYYLSGSTGYYSDLLSLTDNRPRPKNIKADNGRSKKKNKKNAKNETPEKTEPEVLFSYAEMRDFVLRVRSYDQDPFLMAGWNSGPESNTGSGTEPRIFVFVEEMPDYPGGEKELIRFLQKHIVYPGMERDNDIQGKVILKFRVCEDGYLCTASAIRKVSENLETEGIRVLKMMPHWKPGRQSGENVSVWFNLPIVFKLQ